MTAVSALSEHQRELEHQDDAIHFIFNFIRNHYQDIHAVLLHHHSVIKDSQLRMLTNLQLPSSVVNLLGMKCQELNNLIVKTTDSRNHRNWCKIEVTLADLVKSINNQSFRSSLTLPAVGVILQTLFPYIHVDSLNKEIKKILDTGKVQSPPSVHARNTSVASFQEDGSGDQHYGVTEDQRNAATPVDLNTESTEPSPVSNSAEASSKDDCSQKSPHSKKGLWAHIKEVTQRMLKFSESSPHRNHGLIVNESPLSAVEYISETGDSPSKLGELAKTKGEMKTLQFTADEEAALREMIRDEKLIGLNKELAKATAELSKLKGSKVPPSTLSLPMPPPSSVAPAIQRCCNVSAQCRSEVGRCKDSFNLMVMKHSGKKCDPLPSWSAFEAFCEGCDYYVKNHYLDSENIPLAINQHLPRQLAVHCIISIIKMYSLTAKEHSLEKPLIVIKSAEYWKDLPAKKMVENLVKFPEEFSAQGTWFSMTEAGIVCELATNSDKLVTFIVEQNLKNIHKYVLFSDKNPDDFVTWSAKIIGRQLSNKVRGGTHNAVDIYLRDAAQVCFHLGKALIELGRNGQMCFFNLDGQNFAGCSPSDVDYGDGKTLNLSDAINPQVFDSHLLLHLLLVLKAHVLYCYENIWYGGRVEAELYPRLTKLILRSLLRCNLDISSCENMIEIDFKDFWLNVENDFLDALILDASEHISHCERWQNIMLLLTNKLHLCPRDEELIRNHRPFSTTAIRTMDDYLSYKAKKTQLLHRSSTCSSPSMSTSSTEAAAIEEAVVQLPISPLQPCHDEKSTCFGKTDCATRVSDTSTTKCDINTSKDCDTTCNVTASSKVNDASSKVYVADKVNDSNPLTEKKEAATPVHPAQRISTVDIKPIINNRATSVVKVVSRMTQAPEVKKISKYVQAALSFTEETTAVGKDTLELGSSTRVAALSATPCLKQQEVQCSLHSEEADKQSIDSNAMVAEESTETKKKKRKKKPNNKHRFVIAPEYIRAELLASMKSSQSCSNNNDNLVSSPGKDGEMNGTSKKAKPKEEEQGIKEQQDVEKVHHIAKQDELTSTATIERKPLSQQSKESTKSSSAQAEPVEDQKSEAVPLEISLKLTPYAKKRVKTNPKNARFKSKLVQSLEANKKKCGKADGSVASKSPASKPPLAPLKCDGTSDMMIARASRKLTDRTSVSCELDTLDIGSLFTDLSDTATEVEVDITDHVNDEQRDDLEDIVLRPLFDDSVTEDETAVLRDEEPIMILHGRKSDYDDDVSQKRKKLNTRRPKVRCSKVLFPLASEIACIETPTDGFVPDTDQPKATYSSAVVGAGLHFSSDQVDLVRDTTVSLHGAAIVKSDSVDSIDYVELVRQYTENEATKDTDMTKTLERQKRVLNNMTLGNVEAPVSSNHTNSEIPTEDALCASKSTAERKCSKTPKRKSLSRYEVIKVVTTPTIQSSANECKKTEKKIATSAQKRKVTSKVASLAPDRSGKRIVSPDRQPKFTISKSNSVGSSMLRSSGLSQAVKNSCLAGVALPKPQLVRDCKNLDASSDDTIALETRKCGVKPLMSVERLTENTSLLAARRSLDVNPDKASYIGQSNNLHTLSLAKNERHTSRNDASLLNSSKCVSRPTPTDRPINFVTSTAANSTNLSAINPVEAPELASVKTWVCTQVPQSKPVTTAQTKGSAYVTDTGYFSTNSSTRQPVIQTVNHMSGSIPYVLTNANSNVKLASAMAIQRRDIINETSIAQAYESQCKNPSVQPEVSVVNTRVCNTVEVCSNKQLVEKDNCPLPKVTAKLSEKKVQMKGDSQAVNVTAVVPTTVATDAESKESNPVLTVQQNGFQIKKRLGKKMDNATSSVVRKLNTNNLSQTTSVTEKESFPQVHSPRRVDSTSTEMERSGYTSDTCDNINLVSCGIEKKLINVSKELRLLEEPLLKCSSSVKIKDSVSEKKEQNTYETAVAVISIPVQSVNELISPDTQTAAITSVENSQAEDHQTIAVNVVDTNCAISEKANQPKIRHELNPKLQKPQAARFSWNQSFLTQAINDPIEILMSQQKSLVPYHDAFQIQHRPSNTVKNLSPSKANHMSMPSAGQANKALSTYIDSLPESRRAVIGQYTYGMTSTLRVGRSCRDGVDVYTGLSSSLEKVVVKQMLRRSSQLLSLVLIPMSKTNLVKLLDVSAHNPRAVVVVYEHCDCNLRAFIASQQYKDGGLALRKRLCYELLSGVNALHTQCITHNNLKPENVLLGHDGILKIGDFPAVSGWDTLLLMSPCRNPERLCWEATEEKQRLYGYPSHMKDIQGALKIGDNNPTHISLKSGMLLHYIMCDGQHPYGLLTSPISVDSNIRAGLYSISVADKPARHLLTWMLPADPSRRSDSNTCLTHPLFWTQPMQVEFLAAVGRQPEVRSGMHSAVLDQLNALYKYLEFSDWRDRVDVRLPQMVSPREPYLQSIGDMLRFVSDLMRATCLNKDISGICGGDKSTYIQTIFADTVLPIYDVVIKSPLCLRIQLQDILLARTQCNANWHAAVTIG